MKLSDPDLLKDLAYIDGIWQGGVDRARYTVSNPATGAVIASVADLGAVDTQLAIKAAQAALPDWRRRTGKERSSLLRALYSEIVANLEDLAQLITAECGKTLAEARGEIAYGASFFEWFAEEAKRTYGDVIPTTVPGRRILVTREPVGVCGLITPWNFPNALIARKLSPALAAGCTVVLKPSAQTPLSALAIGELAQRVGIPDGVFNIVTASSGPKIGAALTASPIVRKISFTGSTEVGRTLMKQCACSIKKISLELGGNAPFIVFEDADISSAVTGAMASKFRNTGQTCVCVNRFLVQDSVHDRFVAALKEAVETLQVGNGMDDGVTQGPLINADGLAKVQSHVDDALALGGKIVTGGKAHALGGNFYEPTIISNVTPEMKVAREETFGPLAPIFRFNDTDEAIALANDSEFGLAAYFYTRDIRRVWKVAEALEYGIVGINEGIISTEVAPFGGVKQSGLGREGSRYGIDDFMEMKYIAMGGLEE